MYEGSVIEDDSPPSYIKGDIVWVKLSGYWWPGEVKNEEDLPSDLVSDFKKPPLVIVKFFEEESYEYIKHWSNIYPYNCEKKSSFIKKGMAGFRAKLPHLATFPRDIGTAEEKTNGNPNILSQPEYLPNKKINYDEFFGDATPKKGKNSSTVRKSTPKGYDSLITHRRFLGNDDYKAYIMIQQDLENDDKLITGDEIFEKVVEQPNEVLSCRSCSFNTMRLGVMLWHSRMHLEAGNGFEKPIYKIFLGLSITKRKNKKVKHVEVSDGDSETEAPVAQPPKAKQRKKKVEETSQSSNVFTNLLEEWDDTDEEIDIEEGSETTKKSNKVKNSKSKSGENDDPANKVTPNGSSDTSKVLDSSPDLEVKNTQEDIKNCFDFEEEEDEEDFLFPASTGRKIPRVIPEKPRASISELLEQSQKEDELVKGESESNQHEEIEKEDSVDESQSPEKSASDVISLENTFKELMDETEILVSNDLSQPFKPEQNFHDARTIKFPDKGGTTLKESASPKSGTSKKRFITSFEDFEAGFRKISEDTTKKKEESETNDRKSSPSQQTLGVSGQEGLSEHEEHPLKIDENRKNDKTDQVILESGVKHTTTDITCDKIVVGPRMKNRRIKQLVIEEDSEEFIEFATERKSESSADVETKVVQQISNESAIEVDAALEALTKDIGISPITDSKIKEILDCQTHKTEISLEQLRKDLEGTSDSIEVSIGSYVDKKDSNQQLKPTRSKKHKNADRKKKNRKSKISKSVAAPHKLSTVSSEVECSAANELIESNQQITAKTLEENEIHSQVNTMDVASEDPTCSSQDSVRSEPLAETKLDDSRNTQICEQNTLTKQFVTESIPETTVKSQFESVQLIHAEEALLKPVPRRGRSRKHSQEYIVADLLEESVKDESNQSNSNIVSEISCSRPKKSKIQNLTSEEETLKVNTQDLDQNTSAPDQPASPLVEKIVLSRNEQISSKSVKKTKQKREDTHKSDDLKSVDDVRQTRSHKKKELSGAEDEGAQLKEESSVTVEVDVGRKTISLDVKSQDDSNVDVSNNVVSAITEDAVLSTVGSKIRKSPRRKTNKREKTVSPIRKPLEIAEKSYLTSIDKDIDNDKVRNTTKTQEPICVVLPTVENQNRISTSSDEHASLKPASIQSPRARRRATRWNVTEEEEDNCAPVTVETSKVKSDNEITENTEVTSDNITEDLSTLQLSDSAETLPDKIISKTRSGKSLRLDEELMASKNCKSKSPPLRSSLQVPTENKSFADKASCNSERISANQAEFKEHCPELPEEITLEIKNQGQSIAQFRTSESVVDIPLPDKPPVNARRTRSHKLEHEKVVDIKAKQSSTFISGDESQSKRRTRSSTTLKPEIKCNIEKGTGEEISLEVENINDVNKPIEAHEATQSISIHTISGETEKHRRQTVTRRNTRRSEQKQANVFDSTKVETPHSAATSVSQKQVLNEPEDVTLSIQTDIQTAEIDKLQSVQKILPSTDRSISKVHESEKLLQKADKSLDIKVLKEEFQSTSIEPKITESVCDAGSEQNQETINQISERKQDVCSVTGIVSDVIYGRKSRELQSGKSKVVKNRWDVVSCTRNNQKRFQPQSKPAEITQGEENIVDSLSVIIGSKIQDPATIADTSALQKLEFEESNFEATTKVTLEDSSESIASNNDKDTDTGEKQITEVSKDETLEVQERASIAESIVESNKCPDVLPEAISDLQIDNVEKNDDQLAVVSNRLELLAQNAEQVVNDNQTSSVETLTRLEENLNSVYPTEKSCLSIAEPFPDSSVFAETTLQSLESEKCNVIESETISESPKAEYSVLNQVRVNQTVFTQGREDIPNITPEHIECNDEIVVERPFVEHNSSICCEIIQPSSKNTYQNDQIQIQSNQTTDIIQESIESESNLAANLTPEITDPSKLVHDRKFENLNFTTDSVKDADCVQISTNAEVLPEYPILRESIESKMDTKEEAFHIKDNQAVDQVEAISVNSDIVQIPVTSNASEIDHIVDKEPADILIHGEELPKEINVSSCEENKSAEVAFLPEVSTKPDFVDTDVHDPIEVASSSEETFEQTNIQVEDVNNLDIILPKQELELSNANVIENDTLSVDEEVIRNTAKPDKRRSISIAPESTSQTDLSETGSKLNQMLDKSTTLHGEEARVSDTGDNSDLCSTDNTICEDIMREDLSAKFASNSFRAQLSDCPQELESPNRIDHVSVGPEAPQDRPGHPKIDQVEETKELSECQLSETRIPDESNGTSPMFTVSEVVQTSLKSFPESHDDEAQLKDLKSSSGLEEHKIEIKTKDVPVPCCGTESLKSVPPKKNKWSRRSSYSSKEAYADAIKEEDIIKPFTVGEAFEVEPQALNLNSHVIEKTDNGSMKNSENVISNLNDSDIIILPPKKSKRANDTPTQLPKDCFTDECSNVKKSDVDLQFPCFDDSFMSSSFRNNIEGLIKEIDSFDDNDLDEAGISSVQSPKSVQKSDDKEAESSLQCATESTGLLDDKNEKANMDLSKCVPPKKKKIDLPKDESVSILFNQHNQGILFDVKEKVLDSILDTPKKKMQKVFENSQFIEKSEKTIELPQMSPLAKKKSFLFQQELDRLQKVEENCIKVDDAANDKEQANNVSGESNNSETLEESANLVKPTKKRKSLSHDHSPCKKEKLDDSEHLTKPENTPDQFSIESRNTNVEAVQQTSCSTSGTSSDVLKSNIELQVKSELTAENDNCNNQTSTSNALLLKSEEQIPLAEKVVPKKELLDEVMPKFDIKREGMVSSLDTRVSGSTAIQPEMVPISVAPTVMSEQDLADAQVEITSEKIISEKKPTNLGTFSVGFPELEEKSVSLPHTKMAINIKRKLIQTLGTEFTTKAMVKEFDNRSLVTQPNTYVLKSELLDILEGNSNSSTTSSESEQKFKTSFDNYDKQSTVQGIIDFEDAIPSQIVLSNKVKPESVLLDSPKLLERLSMAAKPPPKIMLKSDVNVTEKLPSTMAGKTIKHSVGIPKPGQKILIRNQRAASKIPSSKPVILSDQIIRPAGLCTTTAAKQGIQGVKRQYEDVEDIETAFIIPKIAKKLVEEEVPQPAPPEKSIKSRSKAAGKAKILQQTIISAKGEIVPHATTAISKAPVQLQQLQLQQSVHDESVFDINSMPIVLSDDLLTAESIQNMPVVLSEDGASKNVTVPIPKPNEKIVATLPKKIATALGAKQIIFKGAATGSSIPLPNRLTAKVPKTVTSSTTVPFTKFSKSGTTAFIATGTTADGKPAKYVLVPPAVTPATTQVKSIKPATLKKPAISPKITQSGTAPTSDPSQVVGNKIMIVTNAQGQQTRVVLTPQQQKVFMQGQAGSKTKTIIKGAIPKALLESAAAVAAAGPSGVAVKTTAVISQGATAAFSSSGGLLMSAIKSSKAVVPPKKTLQRPASKPQKTILIKNQLGQTVRKIQGTDDADLDRQVAEQLEAIKASARLQQANKSPEMINYTNRPIPSTTNIISGRSSAIRKAPSKKIDPIKSKIPVAALQGEDQKLPESGVATLHQQPQADQIIAAQPATKKVDHPINKSVDSELHRTTIPAKAEAKQPVTSNETENKRSESPVGQVVIQDGLGNLTTVTVGQILAIPSETVDGQPQSYMLVTVDESGNLTPLNNDALMSLDPSLGAGGDINNVVLQVDQAQGTIAAVKPSVEPSVPNIGLKKDWTNDEQSKTTALKPSPAEPKLSNTEHIKPPESAITVEQQVVIGDGILPGDVGGQQLIVTGDPVATQKFLESLSDGSTDLANILANAENGSVLVQVGGQQILIRTNPAQTVPGNAESNKDITSSSLFASHKPNQDILAAALANTDVFPSTDQPTVHPTILKGTPSSQVSPGSAIFPMHVGNVLETSLTLSSPIMTPLEIPSTNSKKIDAEADILSQVPKNVDLPITITDPNISQTVANQQAATLGALELALPLPDTVAGSINSPSYTYSLPTLEESVGISQKVYSSSMPLLTEDVVESESSVSSDSGRIPINTTSKSGFSPNFSTLPMLETTGGSQREETVKPGNFGDFGSIPMLADDVIDDSESIGSAKLPRYGEKVASGVSLGEAESCLNSRDSLRSEGRDIVDEGLSTLGGEMCSSLSEPPPDMFDLSSITQKEEEISSDMSSIPEGETLSVNSENSGEIPIQPPIIANLNDLKRVGDESEGSDEKKPRYNID